MKDRRTALARSIRITSLVASGMAFLALSGPAQEPPTAGYTETIDVELVNVEARVLDGEGRPVGGLTAEDFEVLVDGSPVEISNFTEFRDGSPIGSGVVMKPGRLAATDHHLIVYFDDLHLVDSHRQKLVESMRQFIGERRIPAERIMILRQGGDLNIVAPFGSSSRSLEKALEGLGTSPAGRGSEAAMQQALDEIQRAWNQSQDATSSGERGPTPYPGASVPGAAAPGSAGTSPRDVTASSGAFGGGLVPQSCEIFESRVEAILSGWMVNRSQNISTTLASLTDSVTYLAGLPGTKSLLYVSDALETTPGLALSNYVDTICPGGQQDRTMQKLGEELESALRALARHAGANRVTIYPLQGGAVQTNRAGGARDSGIRSGSIASFEASRRAGDESGLMLLAEQTGGRAALNQGDYSQALGELSTEMLNYYSLAFQPPAGEVVAAHEIEIRTRDTELEARYLRGYVGKSADQRFSEKLQGALVLGLVDNPLEARLAADAFRTGPDGKTIMPLRVVLPVELVSFMPAGDHLVGSILVRALTRDTATGASSRTDRPFKVKHDPASAGEWMQLPVELELSPGSHVVAIGVLDQESGMTSLISTTVDIPAV